VIGDQRLRLLFDAGTARDVDLSSMDWKGVFEPLPDPEYLAKVKLDPEAAIVCRVTVQSWIPRPSTAEARKDRPSAARKLSARRMG
jgi:hypothetical protein